MTNSTTQQPVLAVTGATGTIGREVLAALLAAGVGPQVRAVVRDPGRVPREVAAQLDVMRADFSEPATLDTAFAGADVVLLLCGHHPDQLALERAGLHAAARAGARRVVYVSAAGVEADPPAALEHDHGILERELAARMSAQKGRGWAVLRPTALFPSLLGGLTALIGPDGTVPLAFGTARVNLVDARDVGQAAAAVLLDPARDGRAWTLTGPHAFTGDELVDAVATGLHRPLHHQDMEPDELAALLRRAGAPPAMTDHLVALFGYFRSGGLQMTTSDVTDLTGRPPRTLNDWLLGPGAALLGAATTT